MIIFLDNNKRSEDELKQTNPFIIMKKSWGIILTDDVQHFYTEQNNTLLKEIKEHTNKWKAIPCYWAAKLISLYFQYF
jgi:hypothetical protein